MAEPEPQVRWVAPGRVNLIGEHTDYNQGLALPFAIPQVCVAAVRRGRTGLTATSAQRDDTVHAEAVDRVLALPTWARYVLGPAWALAQRGVDVGPVQVHVDSEVPQGAGLSSSAAVICAVTLALLDLSGSSLDPDELLALTRQVENDVVGAPTGGLDQLASLRSRPGHALLCDFSSDGAGVSTRDVPLDLAGHGLCLLVLDTRVTHEHSAGEYAQRRATCERAARDLGVASLREVAPDRLADTAGTLDEVAHRRVRHVVTEDRRVRETVALLDAGRPGDIGPLLSASHNSLRDDYEVSVPALDLAQETLLEAGAAGARMTGGGFGGCVIALTDVARREPAVEAVAEAFGRRGWARPRAIPVEPSRGAHRWAEQPA